MSRVGRGEREKAPWRKNSNYFNRRSIGNGSRNATSSSSSSSSSSSLRGSRRFGRDSRREESFAKEIFITSASPLPFPLHDLHTINNRDAEAFIFDSCLRQDLNAIAIPTRGSLPGRALLAAREKNHVSRSDVIRQQTASYNRAAKIHGNPSRRLSD